MSNNNNTLLPPSQRQLLLPPLPPSTSPSPTPAPSISCCHPTTRLFRSVILFLACTLTFGSYFAYDNPGALTEAFKSQVCHNSTTRYELMYSIYSWPNTIQPFIGGYLIDNVLGPRKAAILFCSLVALGTAIVALSTTLEFPHGSFMPFYIAVCGRFVFGLGGESLTVTQNTFVARWFEGRELATAFAICLSFSRIGSALNFAVEKPIANSLGFSYALWASAIFCVVSTLAGMILSTMDRLGEDERVVGPKKKMYDESGKEIAALSEAEIKLEKEEESEPNWRDIRKVLRLREILIYIVCMSFYVAVFVFITIASPFFQRKYSVTPSVANTYVAIPYTVSAIISPILGFCIDYIGYSAQWVLLACLSLTAIHLTLATTMFPPYAMMIWMGCTYSLCAASLWPMVALIVNLKQLGSAYGLMTALQNLGLAVAPLIIGPLVENDDLPSYQFAEFIFAGCAGVAACTTMLLILVDGYTGDGLLYSGSKRIRMMQAKQVRLLRQQKKEKRRKREREAAAAAIGQKGSGGGGGSGGSGGSGSDQRTGYGAMVLSNGMLMSSWQSSVGSSSPTWSPSSSTGGGGGEGMQSSASSILSPKTATEMRST